MLRKRALADLHQATDDKLRRSKSHVGDIVCSAHEPEGFYYLLRINTTSSTGFFNGIRSALFERPAKERWCFMKVSALTFM
jgi:hypothetical protein